jgi:hypothetical protein
MIRSDLFSSDSIDDDDDELASYSSLARQAIHWKGSLSSFSAAARGWMVVASTTGGSKYGLFSVKDTYRGEGIRITTAHQIVNNSRAKKCVGQKACADPIAQIISLWSLSVGSFVCVIVMQGRHMMIVVITFCNRKSALGWVSSIIIVHSTCGLQRSIKSVRARACV